MVNKHISGLSLLEVSLVLLVIGLIIGGVLVGQNLIDAAAIRAQVAQIDRYNTAIKTFEQKYDALPGDISASMVTKYGFTTLPTRAGTAGRGDGNGIIQGYAYVTSVEAGLPCAGENAWVWEDLSANSGLIEGNFNTATDSIYTSAIFAPNITKILPTAKIGNANYVYVYANSSNLNYFGLSSIYEIATNGYIYDGSLSPGLTVAQAYAIDTKIDDGLPQYGNVIAQYLNLTLAGNTVWAAGGGTIGAGSGVNPTTTATPGSSTTCYDNGNVTGVMQYSTEQSGGGQNCALSFQIK